MSPILYVDDHFAVIEAKQQEPPSVISGYQPYGMLSSGYGRKIATRYMVRLDRKGPWRRVYCTQFSNAGSVWIVVKGIVYHFRIDYYLRDTGVIWPRP